MLCHLNSCLVSLKHLLGRGINGVISIEMLYRHVIIKQRQLCPTALRVCV